MSELLRSEEPPHPVECPRCHHATTDCTTCLYITPMHGDGRRMVCNACDGRPRAWEAWRAQHAVSGRLRQARAIASLSAGAVAIIWAGPISASVEEAKKALLIMEAGAVPAARQGPLGDSCARCGLVVLRTAVPLRFQGQVVHDAAGEQLFVHVSCPALPTLPPLPPLPLEWLAAVYDVEVSWLRYGGTAPAGFPSQPRVQLRAAPRPQRVVLASHDGAARPDDLVLRISAMDAHLLRVWLMTDGAPELVALIDALDPCADYPTWDAASCLSVEELSCATLLAQMDLRGLATRVRAAGPADRAFASTDYRNGYADGLEAAAVALAVEDVSTRPEYARDPIDLPADPNPGGARCRP